MNYCTYLLFFSSIFSSILAINSSEALVEETNLNKTLDIITLEIENTQSLIELYEKKISILKQMREYAASNNFPLLELSDEELTRLALSEKRPTPSKPIQVAQESRTHEESILEEVETPNLILNHIIQKLIITEEEDIVCFKFIYIKPLTRSQGGSTMNIGFLVALESGIIKLYDLYGNLLYQLETNAQILFLDTSPHMEEMLFMYVTADFEIGSQIIELEREIFVNQENVEESIEKEEGNIEEEEDWEARQKKTVKKKSGTVAQIGNRRHNELFDKFTYMGGKSKRGLFLPLLNVFLEHLREQVGNEKKGENDPIASEGYAITGMIVFMMRGAKYAFLTDNKGYAMIITSDLQMRNRFFTGFKNVSEIQRYSINILVAAENSVGYMRMGEGTNTPVICEGSTSRVVSITFDQAAPHFFYAGLENGQILVFDTKNVHSRNEKSDCKLLGKLSTNLEHPEKYEKPMAIKGVKGCLVAQLGDGRLNFFNLSEIEENLHPNPVELNPLPETDLNQTLNISDIPVGFLPMVADQRASTGNNYIILRSLGKKNQILIYESMVPYVRPSQGFFDLLNIKFPVILFAFLVIIGYQYFKKKNNPSSSFKGGFGKQKYDEKEYQKILKTMEGLKSQTDGLKDSLGGLGSTGFGKVGKSKDSFEGLRNRLQKGKPQYRATNYNKLEERNSDSDSGPEYFSKKKRR